MKIMKLYPLAHLTKPQPYQPGVERERNPGNTDPQNHLAPLPGRWKNGVRRDRWFRCRSTTGYRLTSLRLVR